MLRAGGIRAALGAALSTCSSSSACPLRGLTIVKESELSVALSTSMMVAFSLATGTPWPSSVKVAAKPVPGALPFRSRNGASLTAVKATVTSAGTDQPVESLTRTRMWRGRVSGAPGCASLCSYESERSTSTNSGTGAVPPTRMTDALLWPTRCRFGVRVTLMDSRSGTSRGSTSTACSSVSCVSSTSVMDASTATAARRPSPSA